MADKQKKPKKEPDYTKMPVLPNRLAEFAQIQAGLNNEELIKLFDSLKRVNAELKVKRRIPVQGKSISKETGGKQRLMSIAEAAEYEKKRLESKTQKEKKIDELLGLAPGTLVEHYEINETIYPRRLAPADIVRYTENAGEKIDLLDSARAVPQRIFMPREETVLDVLSLIKKREAVRVVKRIAERQRAAVLNKTPEEIEAEYAEWLRIQRGDPPPETEEQRTERETKEEQERVEEEARRQEEALRNFDELPGVFTLVDDVTEVVKDNPDAAAAVVRQWIGESVLLGG